MFRGQYNDKEMIYLSNFSFHTVLVKNRFSPHQQILIYVQDAQGVEAFLDSSIKLNQCSKIVLFVFDLFVNVILKISKHLLLLKT